MRLIADSGSTKTAWKVVEDSGLTRDIMTLGMNPFFRTTAEIKEELEQVLLPETGSAIKRIWFYGTGVVNKEKGEVVRQALLQLYPQAEIDIQSDLLGACRALFGDGKGIVCILGTGSNACLFDGEKIVSNIPPLGFILGDEGSGAVMGKHLVGDYFKEVMPEELRKLFQERFQISKDEVLNHIYREARPNHYLAGFTPFLSENIENAYCQEFVTRNFTTFFERNVMNIPNYHDYTIGFVGSVAWHFSEILKNVLESFGICNAVILKEPIDGLVKYHNQD
jgi:glucosamine kinase